MKINPRLLFQLKRAMRSQRKMNGQRVVPPSTEAPPAPEIPVDTVHAFNPPGHLCTPVDSSQAEPV
jgi:hypothetical protein